jgi:hypothetical protein
MLYNSFNCRRLQPTGRSSFKNKDFSPKSIVWAKALLFVSFYIRWLKPRQFSKFPFLPIAIGFSQLEFRYLVIHSIAVGFSQLEFRYLVILSLAVGFSQLEFRYFVIHSIAVGFSRRLEEFPSFCRGQ